MVARAAIVGEVGALAGLGLGPRWGDQTTRHGAVHENIT